MTGITIPFSLTKYRQDLAAGHKKILRRFVILYLLGMVVQGNLLSLTPSMLKFYSNTLQSIAVGYVVAAMVWLHVRDFKYQIAIAAMLTIIYTAGMLLGGDFAPEGNFANKIDEFVLGRFRDDPSYTWIWSSLTFAVTVMLGMFAGIIVHDRKATTATALKLSVIGCVLICVALLCSPVIPIIKRIWSTSMTLYAGGICFILLALFYYIIDCLKIRKGLMWLKIYGMNSITAYVLGETVNFRSIASSVMYGLEQYLGNYYGACLTAANFLIIFVILRYMYRTKTFIKI
jgi:predicted acyltransferase